MLTNRYVQFGAIVLGLLFAIGAITAYGGLTAHTAHGEVNFNDVTDVNSYQTFNFFTSTSTTATSTNTGGGGGYFKIAGAKNVIFYFSRGDTKGNGNSGSSVFRVQVTPDGVNWFDYPELGQVINSATADVFFTRSMLVTVPAGTSTQMWAMEDTGFYAARCIANRVTDGESTCKASADF